MCLRYRCDKPTHSRAGRKRNGCSTQHGFCVSPIRFTSSVFCHLEELGVDCLVGLSQHRDEIAGLPHVVGSEEGISSACLLATSCSANAVDIVLRVVGVVKVDDKFHVFNICKIVLQCGIKEKQDSTQGCAPVPPQQPDQKQRGQVSTVVRWGWQVNPQRLQETALDNILTHNSTGRLRWEKRNDAHSINFQSIGINLILPPIQSNHPHKERIRNLTIFWSMHSLVHSHCSTRPSYCQVTLRCVYTVGLLSTLLPPSV